MKNIPPVKLRLDGWLYVKTNCQLQICQTTKKCQMPDSCGDDGCILFSKSRQYKPLYKSGAGHSEQED